MGVRVGKREGRRMEREGKKGRSEKKGFRKGGYGECRQCQKGQ